MRVTQSMYYNGMFDTNNAKLNRELFDVNKQIASGVKIQYASDDIRVFSETMRLDNELVTIQQTKNSVESGYKFSDQTDVTLSEFTDDIERMRTLLVQAGNGTNDEASMDAIAAELRGIESNLKSLSNTSINGQYLFSGSAVDRKPIDDKGIYHGNDADMEAFVGSHNKQTYNITGSDLFLGEEVSTKREITTNVVHSNLLIDYPNLQASDDDTKALTPSSSIRNLMGDTDDVVDTDEKHFFYLRGTKSDGTSFKEKMQMKDTDTVEDLMDRIGSAYGNTNSVGAVDVRLNSSGEIVVEDRLRGSSKLDFHMVGAVDFSGGSDANVSNLDDLFDGESNFDNIINGNSTAAKPDLYVKEFTKSGLSSVSPIEGVIYDRADFTKDGSRLSSNSSQILKSSHYVTENLNIVDTIGAEKENAFAQPNTLLSEVADTKTEITPATTPKTYTLDGSELTMVGVDINGNDFDVKINLDASDSSFTINGGTKINIYNVDGSITEPDKVTYQQLMDVMNMATTGVFPTTNSSSDYQAQIKESKKFGETSLSYDGKIGFRDLTGSITRAEIALYDSNTNDFDSNASIMTFNSNNSLTVSDPKTDFFKSIDEAIKGVENYSSYPDSDSKYGRTLGVENAIQVIDDLSNHVFKTQSIAGAQSNTLSTTLNQTSVLEMSTISLRSSVLDTDIAEASVRLSQLNLNYEAMLSTVSKVSQLSLVNYL